MISLIKKPKMKTLKKEIHVNKKQYNFLEWVGKE